MLLSTRLCTVPVGNKINIYSRLLYLDFDLLTGELILEQKRLGLFVPIYSYRSKHHYHQACSRVLRLFLRLVSVSPSGKVCSMSLGFLI